WYELSLCSVPANPEAVIETVKRGPRYGRATPSNARTGQRVKLAPPDMVMGKLLADADRRRAARKRLGIPGQVVKLDPVEVFCLKARDKRRQRASRDRRGSAVKLRSR